LATNGARKSTMVDQVWWYTPVIPVLRSPKQEDHEFKASLSYIVRPPSQQVKTTKEKAQ
jgi:hypothetical protein